MHSLSSMVGGVRQDLYVVSDLSEALFQGGILLQIGDFGCLGGAIHRIACPNNDRLDVPVL